MMKVDAVSSTYSSSSSTSTSTSVLVVLTVFIIAIIVLLVVAIIGLYKVYRRVLEQTKKVVPGIPTAKGCHWFFGHQYLFTTTNQTKLDAIPTTTTSTTIDVMKIQKNLAIDSANRYGQTCFWIGRYRYVSLIRWEDIHSIKTYPSVKFSYKQKWNASQLEFCSVFQQKDNTNYALWRWWLWSLFVSPKNRLLTTSKNNQEWLSCEQLTNIYLTTPHTRSFISKVTHHTIKQACVDLTTKLYNKMFSDNSVHKQNAFCNDTINISSSTSSTNKIKIPMISFVQQIVADIFCQIFFSQPFDNECGKYRFFNPKGKNKPYQPSYPYQRHDTTTSPSRRSSSPLAYGESSLMSLFVSSSTTATTTTNNFFLLQKRTQFLDRQKTTTTTDDYRNNVVMTNSVIRQYIHERLLERQPNNTTPYFSNAQRIHIPFTKMIHNYFSYLETTTILPPPKHKPYRDGLEMLIKEFHNRQCQNHQQQAQKLQQSEKRETTTKKHCHDDSSTNTTTELETIERYLQLLMTDWISFATSNLIYALYTISQNPSIEQTCINEIKTTIHKDNNDDDDSMLMLLSSHQVPYCRAVILETFRLYPPKVSATKIIPNNINYPQNHSSSMRFRRSNSSSSTSTIPNNNNNNNTFVYIPIWSIHRMKRSFPRPNEFRPDRWVCQRQQAERQHHQQHIKFQYHSCYNNNSPLSTTNTLLSSWMDRPLTDCTSDIPPGNRKALVPFCCTALSGNVDTMEQYIIEQNTILLVHLLKQFHFETEILDKNSREEKATTTTTTNNVVFVHSSASSHCIEANDEDEDQIVQYLEQPNEFMSLYVSKRTTLG